MYWLIFQGCLFVSVHPTTFLASAKRTLHVGMTKSVFPQRKQPLAFALGRSSKFSRVSFCMSLPENFLGLRKKDCPMLAWQKVFSPKESNRSLAFLFSAGQASFHWCLFCKSLSENFLGLLKKDCFVLAWQKVLSPKESNRSPLCSRPVKQKLLFDAVLPHTYKTAQTAGTAVTSFCEEERNPWRRNLSKHDSPQLCRHPVRKIHIVLQYSMRPFLPNVCMILPPSASSVPFACHPTRWPPSTTLGPTLRTRSSLGVPGQRRWRNSTIACRRSSRMPSKKWMVFLTFLSEWLVISRGAGYVAGGARNTPGIYYRLAGAAEKVKREKNRDQDCLL